MVFYNQNDFQKSLNDFLEKIPNNIEKVRYKGNDFFNIASSFDIETTSFLENGDKKAIMYIWQFAINDDVILGRKWTDFLLLLKKLQNKYFIDLKNRFVIYIHNLSYEFQFMCKWFNWFSIFATDERKPLYCITKSGFEFRCSYRLSGYSLATVAKNLTRFNIKKLVGDLDYSLIRNEKTVLSNKEIEYCINDVLIVTSYIRECIEDYKNIANIPLTQTGKVRRYVRNECFKEKSYKYLMRKLELTSVEYLQLRKAFQGGFTHANRMYVMQNNFDVTSYDFTSSYPTVMVTEKYPMSKAKYIGKCTNEQYNYYSKNYCCIFDIKLNNVTSKICFENYISFSKCYRIENYVLNNGRVFSADSLVMTITNIDFEIIEKCYNFTSYEIRNLYIYEKNYLPKTFILSILKLYNDKTKLKGVKGKEVEYLHSKEMLNSCYGMSVTDLLNNEYIFESNNNWNTKETNVNDAIEKYNKDKNRFLFYAWGVFVTAYARKNLFSGILECKTDYIYSDTDSIKIFNANEHIDYIEKYNKMIKMKLKTMCSFYNIDFDLCKPKTIDGKIKLLGVWDYDGHYKIFKSLGAKRYLCLDDDNNLNLTVAGINKKLAIPYLKEKYKTYENIFNNFNDCLIIPKDYSGKMILTYCDNEINGIVKDYRGNYSEYYEKSYIHMDKSEYNLNIACEYLDFILKFNKKS